MRELFSKLCLYNVSIVFEFYFKLSSLAYEYNITLRCRFKLQYQMSEIKIIKMMPWNVLDKRTKIDVLTFSTLVSTD